MLARIPLSTRLFGLAVLTFIVVAVITFLGLSGMKGIQAHVNALYEDSVKPLGQAALVSESLQEMRSRALVVLMTNDAEGLIKQGRADAVFSALDKAIDDNWDAFVKYNAPAEQKTVADAFSAELARYRSARSETFAAIGSGDSEKASAVARSQAGPAFNGVLNALKKITEIRVQDSRQRYIEAENEYNAALKIDIVFVVVGVLLSAALTRAVHHSITVPLGEMIKVMGRIAENDTSVTVSGCDLPTEIGQVARAVEVFRVNTIERLRMAQNERDAQAAREARAQTIEGLIGEFDRVISEVLSVGAGAATELDAAAQSMASTAVQTNRQAATVAAASEEASVSAQTVASAAEELSASITEIARQVEHSNQITRTTSEEANLASETVRGLADRSSKIGEVVSLINDIASQTNLLALNATIEAARAGEAGKGFAVVANEVKNLANQTGRATGEISAQIGAVQSVTQDVVNVIVRIVARIEEINQIAAAIAAAVEEQAAATAEIARNVEQTAAGTQEISVSIVGVTRAAAETESAAGQVLESARSLSQDATMLKGAVGMFLTGVRSA